MKGDFSRQTFDADKRYNAVLMQQGRVQLDSDWNEQQEIHQHRAETGAGDMVGPAGPPVGDGRKAGFKVTMKDGRLCLSAGHIYVDGILCVNEDKVIYDAEPGQQGGQPYPPAPVAKLSGDLKGWLEDQNARLGLAYLDVWERHVTHHDDERLREVALGGPDTTTRKQTIWQMRLLELKNVPAGDLTLLSQYADLRDKPNPTQAEKEEWNDISPRAVKLLGDLCKSALTAVKTPPSGKLRVELNRDKDVPDRCRIPPDGGYERLENQLYRVEVHESGNISSARFKWSRDNGSVVTGIEGANGKEITVKDTGRDELLGFATGQWVEVVDDHTELQGEPHDLLRISGDVDRDGRIVPVEQDPPAIDPELHPKLRRWDQSHEDPNAKEDGIALENGRLKLEGGIEAVFSSGYYRAGDYWLIPARTATGDVEWPLQADGKTYKELAPHGVRHSFCSLAVLLAPSGQSSTLTVLHDCRDLFPRLTDLKSFFYLGGDGQEAMPGKDLLEPLRVGVANGRWPVPGARIRFEVLDSGGTLTTTDRTLGSQNGVLSVLTDKDGVAACCWKLDVTNQGQGVKATLLDAEDGTTHLPIYFHANRSVASEVYFDPKTCGNLQGADNVQKALEQLSTLKSLYYLSGDSQHVPPDEVGSLESLKVLVANDCGSVAGTKVEFKVAPGNGAVGAPGTAGAATTFETTTNAQGVAECKWTLDGQTPVQRVRAALSPAANGTRGPTCFVFTATLNKGQARHTAYDPQRCANLSAAQTVQAAIDSLCQNSTLHYVGGDGQEVMPGEQLPRPLQVRVANGRWPVQGAQVRFQTDSGTLTAGTQSGSSVTPETEANGLAECTWQLDPASDSPKQVEAYLLAGAGHRLEPPVRFGANLSVASRVAYDPTCELLANTRTVQEALDELCDRGGGAPEPEPGFHIAEVRRLKDDEPLRNGSSVGVFDLMEGLRIVCDQEVEARTVNQATCFVTLDLHYPLTQDDAHVFGEWYFGFRPVVLSSTLKTDGGVIEWRPRVGQRISNTFIGSIGLVPAHLTLRGNFVRADGQPEVYLDGDTFADPEAEFGVRLPSGDGRRGGDFEMHFSVEFPWIG